MNNARKSLPARPRNARIEKDSDAVFDEAIRAGVLSDDPQHERFAGHYMYMHHSADGMAWFKHKETRAYITMPPQSVQPQTHEARDAPNGRDGQARRQRPNRPNGRSDLKSAPGPGLWATVILAVGFAGGALVDFSRGPTIGTVRLNDLTSEFVVEAVRDEESGNTALAVRTWAGELQGALDEIAVRHGVVLLAVEAVAAGARDYTPEIRAAMRRMAADTAASGGAGNNPAETGR